MVSLQGMKMASFVHPWSVIVNIKSYPPDVGSLTIKSSDMVENGVVSGLGYIGDRGAFFAWVLVLFHWHSVHPLTYISTSEASFGHQKHWLIVVWEIPGWPYARELWWSWMICWQTGRSPVMTSWLSFHHLPSCSVRLCAAIHRHSTLLSWSVRAALMKSCSGSTVCFCCPSLLSHNQGI